MCILLPVVFCMLGFVFFCFVSSDLSSRDDHLFVTSSPVLPFNFTSPPPTPLKVLYTVMFSGTRGGKCVCVVHSLESEAFNFTFSNKKWGWGRTALHMYALICKDWYEGSGKHENVHTRVNIWFETLAIYFPWVESSIDFVNNIISFWNCEYDLD